MTRRAAFVLAALLLTVSATAQTTDSQQSTVPIPVRLETPGRSRIIVLDARITSEMDLRSLQAAPIVEMLRDIVAAEVALLLEEASIDGWLSTGELTTIGMTARFDTADLAAAVTVPVDLMAESVIEVAGSNPLPPYRALYPSLFAVGLPVNLEFNAVRTRIAETTGYGAEAIFRPGISVYDVVLESQITLERSGDETNTSVQDTRVVYDYEPWGLRLSAGQLQPAARGFQSTRALAGVSVVPQRFSPASAAGSGLYSQQIVLDAKSTANVIINDRLIRSIPLEPGIYRLEEFPLSPGLNDIRIDVIDEFGDVETVGRTIPYARQLLLPGAYDFALAAGVEPWDVALPFLTGYLRRGVTEAITAGTTLQLGRHYLLSSLDAIYATPVGTVSGDVALSTKEWGRTGFANRLTYRFALPRARYPWLPTVSTSVQYRNPGFRPSETVSDVGRTKWTNTFTLIQPMPWDLALAVGFSQRLYHAGEDRSGLAYVNLGRRVGRNGSVRIVGEYDFLKTDDNWGVQITFNMRFGGVGSASTTINTPEREVDIVGTAGTDLGRYQVSGDANIQNFRLTDGGLGGVGGSARFTGPAFSTALFGNVRLVGEGSIGDQQYDLVRYGVRGGTGLYYADRVFGFGRAARNSFAVVRADPAMPKNRVVVNESGGVVDGRSSFLGAATSTAYSAYSPKALQAQLTGLPADYSIGNTSFLYYPRYRSGVGVTIAGSRRVYVRGTLLNAEGAPVALSGLLVVPLFEPEIDESETAVGGWSFTDENGVFEIYGLVPGRYQIMVKGSEERSSLFDLEETEERFVEIGTVEVYE